MVKDRRKSSLIRWHNRRKTLITLRWDRGIPRLVIHEKYEKHAKWFLRILTLIAIVTSIGFIPIWHVSLLLAIILVGIEQFLERAVFLYTIFYFTPLPNFNWNIGEEWEAMGFAFPVTKNKRELNVMGPVFRSVSCAQEFFQLLHEWNYNEVEDRDNNVCVSLITVDDGYYTFIYPNLLRRTVQETFSEIEEISMLEKYGKESQKFIVQQIFCKHFTYASNSMFNRFSQEQTNDKPYWLQPFKQNPDGSVGILFSVEPILKFHVKIGERSKLNQVDIEYQYFKYVIDVKPKTE